MKGLHNTKSIYTQVVVKNKIKSTRKYIQLKKKILHAGTKYSQTNKKWYKCKWWNVGQGRTHFGAWARPLQSSSLRSNHRHRHHRRRRKRHGQDHSNHPHRYRCSDLADLSLFFGGWLFWLLVVGLMVVGWSGCGCEIWVDIGVWVWVDQVGWFWLIMFWL